MPRNNQLLHFAFREDKQWKLQQVTGPFQGRGPGHKGRQEQALGALRPPGLAAVGPCGCSGLKKIFPNSAAGVGSAWSPSLSCNWAWLLPPPSPLSLAISCFHFTVFAWTCPSAWSPLPQLLPPHKLPFKSCLPSPPRPRPPSPCFLVKAEQAIILCLSSATLCPPLESELQGTGERGCLTAPARPGRRHPPHPH